jgi:hypothetical protein
VCLLLLLLLLVVVLMVVVLSTGLPSVAALQWWTSHLLPRWRSEWQKHRWGVCGNTAGGGSVVRLCWPVVHDRKQSSHITAAP